MVDRQEHKSVTKARTTCVSHGSCNPSATRQSHAQLHCIKLFTLFQRKAQTLEHELSKAMSLPLLNTQQQQQQQQQQPTNNQQATSNKQQATNNKHQATSNKQQATSNKQQATTTTTTTTNNNNNNNNT